MGVCVCTCVIVSFACVWAHWWSHSPTHLLWNSLVVLITSCWYVTSYRWVCVDARSCRGNWSCRLACSLRVLTELCCLCCTQCGRSTMRTCLTRWLRKNSGHGSFSRTTFTVTASTLLAKTSLQIVPKLTNRVCMYIVHRARTATMFCFFLTNTHTHPFNGLCPGLPWWAGTREVKPIWISPKQETVSGSGIS